MPGYDVAIIGAGPGGYVAAIRAAQFGLATVLIEKESVGGLCLNWGCIPSKSLLYAAEVANLVRRGPEFGVSFTGLTLDLAVAVDRSRDIVTKFVGGVETLLRRNGVSLVQGSGRLTSPNHIEVQPSGETIEAQNVIVATGAATRSLPGVPVDGERVLTSRQALALRRAPRSIIIIGGGAIGVEFAYFFRAYGATVTIVELLDRLLPAEDEDVSRQLERSFRAQGIDVQTATRVEGIEVDGDQVKVATAHGEDRTELRAEQVLAGVGFAPASDDLGLGAIGVELEGGWVKVDAYCRTSVPSVWAAGDVTGRLLLAHVASRQGITAVEKIAGQDPPPIDYDQMPRAVYCQPQVASLGVTESEAKERGFDVRAGRFPLRANAKAVALGETDGFVKIVADKKTGRVLGYHMIGHNVTELLGEASLGATLDATFDQLSRAMHPHPTFSEAVGEAALALQDGAFHFFSERRPER